MTRPDLTTKQWRAKRLVVLARDRYTCYVCNGEATQVDHIIAKVNGGTEDLGNLAAICRDCNSRKGSQVDRPRKGTMPQATGDFQSGGTQIGRAHV